MIRLTALRRLSRGSVGGDEFSIVARRYPQPNVPFLRGARSDLIRISAVVTIATLACANSRNLVPYSIEPRQPSGPWTADTCAAKEGQIQAKRRSVTLPFAGLIRHPPKRRGGTHGTRAKLDFPHLGSSASRPSRSPMSICRLFGHGPQATSISHPRSRRLSPAGCPPTGSPRS